MEIKKLHGLLLDANEYVVCSDKECLLIDCGARLDDVIMATGGKKVVGILLTHGHYDHSLNCLEQAKHFDCKIYANENIKDTLMDQEASYSEDGIIIDDFSRFEFIEGDKKIKVGRFIIDCYYCPGHSNCCECYMIDGLLFAGDVLFENGVGRTDLKSSSREKMYNSLCKLEKIKFDKVYSGHGNASDYDFQMKNISIFKRFLSR